MSGNFKFSGFGYLQKELQALLLFKNSIGGEKHLQKQQDLMTRIGSFSGLFVIKELVPTSCTNNGTITTAIPEAASVNSTLVLLLVPKPEHHCIGTHKRFIVGSASGITVPLLLAVSLKLNLQRWMTGNNQVRLLDHVAVTSTINCPKFEDDEGCQEKKWKKATHWVQIEDLLTLTRFEASRL